jgi:ribosomal protein L40E
MSHLFTLQCLFCQHLNPPDADDCIRCEGQLNLQPCHQCGAVDLRTATKCYRCGAAFSLIDASEFDFSVPPWIADKSAAPGAVASKVQHPVARLSDSPPGRQTAELTHSPATPASLTDRSRGRSMAMMAILFLLASAAVAVYLNRGPSLAPARTQAPNQPVSDLAGARQPEKSAPLNAAAAVDVASKPAVVNQPRAASVNRPAPTLSLATSDVRSALPAQPVPPVEAETKTLQDRTAAAQTCPPAVAALGLCDPDLPREKP